MTDHDDVEQRAYHQPDPDRITLRDEDDSNEGLFRVRMPISSTLEARDGDAFERDRLEGWATQINEGTVPVYGDHGANRDLAGSRYSAFGKLGYYADADVQEIDGREDEYELVADTLVMEPDSLPEETGSLRENLTRLKAQVERNVPITQSVGWSDDVGDRDVPGGSDLLEGSIVGIPSDAHASSTNGAGVTAAARAAVAAGADPDSLVEEFRAVVMGSDERDTDDMSDNTDSPDDESGDDREETDGIDAEEFREQMLEMQRNQTETLNTLAEALREDDEDDDEDEEEDDSDDDGDEGEDDEDEESERTVTIDGEEVEAREAIAQLRANLEDADPDVPGDDADENRDEQPDNQPADPRNLL